MTGRTDEQTGYNGVENAERHGVGGAVFTGCAFFLALRSPLTFSGHLTLHHPRSAQ